MGFLTKSTFYVFLLFCIVVDKVISDCAHNVGKTFPEGLHPSVHFGNALTNYTSASIQSANANVIGYYIHLFDKINSLRPVEVYSPKQFCKQRYDNGELMFLEEELCMEALLIMLTDKDGDPDARKMCVERMRGYTAFEIVYFKHTFEDVEKFKLFPKIPKTTPNHILLLFTKKRDVMTWFYNYLVNTVLRIVQLDRTLFPSIQDYCALETS